MHNNYSSTVKIADVIVQMNAKYPIVKPTYPAPVVENQMNEERFKSFFCSGEEKADIVVDIDIVSKVPAYDDTSQVFITYHFQGNQENWRLLKKGDEYIYKCPLEAREQVMVVNKSFDRVKAYLLENPERGKTWYPTDIIYDFLQVLLINYFGFNNSGVITHAVGIKDVNDKGYVFAGKSGNGKTTTARIWNANSKALVVNDDRVIIRKIDGKFIMYGSPWHGEFNDYLESRVEDAELEKLLFIYHSKENISRPVSAAEAFTNLYTAMFPPFWDKQALANTAAFCQDLVSSVPCYSLGFVNDDKVIDFVRNINN